MRHGREGNGLVAVAVAAGVAGAVRRRGVDFGVADAARQPAAADDRAARAGARRAGGVSPLSLGKHKRTPTRR